MADASRSLGEIEQDIVKINETLATISEVRSALKDFTSIVLQETKQPNYVHAFSDRLNHVKRGVNRLAAESEGLKGGLSYAQIAANKTYHWPTIRNAVENNAAAEERRQAETNAGRPRDPCLLIKKNTDRTFREFSPVVLDRKAPSTTPNYITTHINEWLAHEKPSNVMLSIHFDQPEHETVSGSSCSFTVSLLFCYFAHCSRSNLLSRLLYIKH
ncbi:hypothetical protein BJV82DRAFT_320676 [Fennellomyces sp. T-0311]|nr:hypothetical protein BJV82DRAFT_320676 [Fennellomyces sp. T-0311]